MSDKVPLTISVGEQTKGPSGTGGVRLAATLAIAGALSGVILAGVFQVTKPIIDANNARELKKAVLKVVPNSTQMQKFVLRDGQLQLGDDDDTQTTEPVVYAAFDEAGKFLGYAIEGQGPGFQDTIRLLYGYDPSKQMVIGMEILESKETPGLGDKIFKDQAFADNFKTLSVVPRIVISKEHRTAGDNQVDAITGATISSKAVVKILNTTNEQWLTHLPGEVARAAKGGE